MSCLFNISPKCSTHLCSLSLISVLSTPCFSFTLTFCLRHSLAIVLVMLYSSLFLLSVAFSAAVALFFIQFLLPYLALLFTSLFFTLYSLSLSQSFRSSTLHFQFCLFPLLDLFSCFLPYPWFALLFRPPNNFLCSISVCCQNQIVANQT